MPLQFMQPLDCLLSLILATVQGTEGPWAAAFAQVMNGSPDLYSQTQPAEGEWWANNGGRKWKGGRAPAHSINFVTAHDGFSLADLTAYNEKHNDANGEQNRSALHDSVYTFVTIYAALRPPLHLQLMIFTAHCLQPKYVVCSPGMAKATT